MATLLVADDHPDAVELLSIFFQLAGYTVITAQDGIEAVAAVQKHAPDVVLMDLWMPRLDGVAATRQIRAFPEHAHLPVIAYTANAAILKGDRGLFSAVCEKPCRPSDVVQVVADVLASRARGRARN
jgi:CheY-like chemotaxis protein